MADDARLTEIEVALAHQGRQADELSEVVRAQADRIDVLERRLAHLLARLAELEAADAGPFSPDVRPPHW